MIFWDVDTQYDFMMADGKLYVPRAEEIVANLEKLTLHARNNRIRILGTMDFHDPEDPEISENPDFQNTFPPHCLQNTPGAERIEATRPLNPLWVENHVYPEGELEKEVEGHEGEIYFRKNGVDVFTNPNIDRILSILQPRTIVVYGVATDFCDAASIRGFLERGKYELQFVKDAAKPIDQELAETLLEEWAQAGVKIITTEEIVR